MIRYEFYDTKGEGYVNVSETPYLLFFKLSCYKTLTFNEQMEQFYSKSQSKTLKGSSLVTCLPSAKLDPFCIYMGRGGERGLGWFGRRRRGGSVFPVQE